MTQVRGGTGLFTGRPAYVWISNQIGNTGVLIGERIVNAPAHGVPVQARPVDLQADKRRPAHGASSYELNVTDTDFRFPQVWRSNIAVDRRLPGGIVEHDRVPLQQGRQRHLLHQRQPAGGAGDVRRASMPAAVGRRGVRGDRQPAACINRINNDPGNQVTANYVLKNQNIGQFVELLGDRCRRR